MSESSGQVTLAGALTTTGDASVGGNTHVGGRLTTAGDANVGGNTHVFGLLTTAGDANVGFNIHVGGDVLIENGDLDLPRTNGSSVGVINMAGSPFIHGFEGGNGTFVGGDAGNFGLSGPGNTGIGYLTLASDTTGSDNTAIGVTSLHLNTIGAGNTAVGLQALNGNTTGIRNTAVGVAAGANGNVTGSHNTFIGAVADGGSSDLINATAIGYNAIVNESNALVLGGTGENAVNVGIGTQAPVTRLHVAAGDVGTSNPGAGLVVKSPDGAKCARIGIDNTGAIAVTSLACPF